MEEINKSLRESQEKTNQQINETVQDLEIETEARKKTQIEGMLKMETLGKWIGTKERCKDCHQNAKDRRDSQILNGVANPSVYVLLLLANE